MRSAPSQGNPYSGGAQPILTNDIFGGINIGAEEEKKEPTISENHYQESVNSNHQGSDQGGIFSSLTSMIMGKPTDLTNPGQFSSIGSA